MEDSIRYPIIGRVYQHYKGGKYKILTMANHSETGEALVVYQSILFGSTYARPLFMFFEEVGKKKVGQGKGKEDKEVPLLRFEQDKYY